MGHPGRGSLRSTSGCCGTTSAVTARAASTPGDYRVEQLARDLLALLDALGDRSGRTLRLSLGGMIGMWLAVHAPERLTALVLANTSPRPDAA